MNYSCSQSINSKQSDNQSLLMTIVHSTLHVMQLIFVLVFVLVLRCFILAIYFLFFSLIINFSNSQ